MTNNQNYYFTFGQSHVQTDGTPMKDYWVRVIAKDYDDARRLFVERFSSICMPSSDKWAFQYEEKDWNPEMFPRGEYEVIQDDAAMCGEIAETFTNTRDLLRKITESHKS